MPLSCLGVFKHINQCHCPGWGYLNIYISVTLHLNVKNSHCNANMSSRDVTDTRTQPSIVKDCTSRYVVCYYCPSMSGVTLRHLTPSPHNSVIMQSGQRGALLTVAHCGGYWLLWQMFLPRSLRRMFSCLCSSFETQQKSVCSSNEYQFQLKSKYRYNGIEASKEFPIKIAFVLKTCC